MNAVLENLEKIWTYEEYACLDDAVFEIINGKAIMSPSPELFHQQWVGDLFAVIRQHVKAHELGKVFVAPIDVVLDRDNVVQPDLVFVSTANAGLLERRGIMGAPDLVVEVISPGSLRRDRYDKRDLYARFGVKEFWLADVANRSLEVLTLHTDGYRLSSCATGEGKIHSTILPGFEVDLAQLD
jgi:Uma2 family endonuclease